ncbi:iron-containing alcohol dehydrogenase [Clostridium sp. BJN0001]|uniref:iron-containing alcohol dehydrogenase n=1 Tax=Clostridium sp. BJN0001 TaxID=2930219 RepID=UPI001FD0AA68|nr:iron-containing alcohol dehydrogenase [Clostridium sp. BJN0001]
MSIILNRTIQFVVKNYFKTLKFRVPELIEGIDSVYKVSEIILKNKLGRPLIVTGPNLYKKGMINSLLNDLDKNSIKYSIYKDVVQNPTDINVEEGLNIYKRDNCKMLIGIGGGSPIDCCKAIGARVIHPNKKVSDLIGMKVKKKIPTFIAIPTTAGTGTETTMYAVITDSKTHHKQGMGDIALIPDFAVLDPKFIITLPPSVTAMTGMDALCHAVESYTNYKYTTKLEQDNAKKAVKLIYDNLLNSYKDGNNINARINMQRASFAAGIAFNRGMVGYVHSIGHTLSGLYNIPHGLAMAVLLPKVMRQYGKSVYDKLADLADVCFIKGNDKKDKSDKFIKWIENINREMNIKSKFDMIKESDIQKMVKWAMQEGKIYPTPQIWEKKDFEKCIRKIIL